MLKRKIGAGLVLLLAMGTPAVASGPSVGGASTTIRLQAFVPVICRVQLSASIRPIENGMVELGMADEFCNAPRGYRVLLQHAPDLEGAAVISGGLRIPLSASGETVLTDSRHADMRSVALVLDPGETPDRLRSIGMRIEPRG